VPTNYPGGTDKFFEPSLPEQIPLSQTGYQPGSEDVDGRRARNHVEHHRDLGDAVQALEENAAQVTHDHSGNSSNTTKGAKLKQANTHEQADTDLALTSLHHTLGTGAFQAAPGDHTHDFNAPGGGGIVNAPFLRCTSTTKPGDPGTTIPRTDGLTIYETDTKRMRVWGDFGNGNGERWNILPTANIPIVRLVQGGTGQAITEASGAIMKWTEVEDNFGFFNPSTTDASKQQIKVTEPGVYQIDCAVQWGGNFVPEVATIVACVDGAETELRYSKLQPTNLLTLLGISVIDGVHSQTVALSGKLRVGYNQVVTIKCKYAGLTPVGTFINTFIDLDTKVKSRLDMHYVGP